MKNKLHRALHGNGEEIVVATWNIGSLNSRLGDLVEWLALARPSIVFLQEAKWSPDIAARLAVHLRPFGYTFLVDIRSDLVVVHLSGLQLFNLAPRPGDEAWRLQRVGFFLV